MNKGQSVCVCVYSYTFRDGDVAPQVAITKQPPEGHVLESNSLQL